MRKSKFFKTFFKSGTGYAMHVPMEYIREFGPEQLFLMLVGPDGQIHLTPQGDENDGTES